MNDDTTKQILEELEDFEKWWNSALFKPPSPELRKLAEEALDYQREDREPVEQWAKRLAEDLSKFTD